MVRIMLGVGFGGKVSLALTASKEILLDSDLTLTLKGY